MESNQIAVEDTQEKFFSNWKNSVDLTTGKWCVQKEANLDILLGRANLFSQHLWQKHEMVVVNPDQITILHILGHYNRKLSIDILVCFPCSLVECNLSRMVMEQWPEDRICKHGQMWPPTHASYNLLENPL